MTKPIARDPIYRRRRFEGETIELCVRWYISYRLSYRDLVAMMAERGLIVSHTTILRWVIRYVPEFEKRWNRWARRMHSSWRVDQTYISVRGRWHYLYRAVDKHGKSVDFLLRPDRGIAAAGVLSESSGDELATVAAQGDARWPRAESSSVTASSTGGSEVEVRGGEKLSLPQQHRRAGSSCDQTPVRLDDGL